MGKETKTFSILIIDDSATNNLLISETIKEEGYDAFFVNSANAALDFLERTPDVNLILLDIMMPKIDGFELLTKLKADDNHKHIPVIIVSAKVQKEFVKKAYEMGATDYVKKPIIIDELMEKIKTISEDE